MSATAINSHLFLTGSWEIQWQLYQIHYLDSTTVSLLKSGITDLIAQKSQKEAESYTGMLSTAGSTSQEDRGQKRCPWAYSF